MSAMRTRNVALWGGLLLVAVAPLTLTGCNNAKTIQSRDSLYCEQQGFPPGTDNNVACALQHQEEREASGVPQGPDPTETPETVGPPPPPRRVGGVHQSLGLEAISGVTLNVFFAFTVKDDCTSDAPPEFKIEKQPQHGKIAIVPHTDYANASPLNGAPAACADKKVSGLLMEYTPAGNYQGEDDLKFETVGKKGASTIFYTSILIDKPPPTGPASNYDDDD